VTRRTYLIVAVTLGLMASSCAEEGKIMDSATAYKLVTDWARVEKEDTSGIEREANGDFYGKAAVLGFQFDNARQNLVVRGRIMIDADKLSKTQDMMQELHRIAREEPDRVVHAQFEIVRMPWDTGEQPTLYLRRDYKTSESESKLFDEWRKLREMAYLWHRTYFRQAIGPIVERRSKAK